MKLFQVIRRYISIFDRKWIVLQGIYVFKLLNYSRVQDFNEQIKVLVKKQ
jgi:hypothetical protein